MTVINQIVRRFGVFSTVVVLTLLALILIDIQQFYIILPIFILYLIPPLGKDTLIPTAVALGAEPIILALTITAADIAIGLLFIENWDLILKIPYVGPFLEKINAKLKIFIDRNPKMRELAFTGIVFLMVVPFRGIGAIEAVFISKVLGMRKWKVMNAIIIGSLISTISLSYASHVFAPLLKKYPLIAAMVVFVVLLVSYTVYRQNRKKRNTRVKEEPKTLKTA